MKISAEQLRRAILNTVQPLNRGKFKVKADPFSTLIDIPQFDSFNRFIDAATPFGMSVNPSDQVLAYYFNLGGDGLAPIILGHQDLKRPLGNKGSTILYSTDSAGDSIKTKIQLKETGDLEFESIDGAIKALITAGGKILLGSGASGEPLVLGTAFTTLYNAHAHIGNLGVPTGTPINPMGAPEISTKSFTEI